jgi:signal transduction histidine kinase
LSRSPTRSPTGREPAAPATAEPLRLRLPADDSLEPAAALAGTVAHDLGNLLTVMLGNAELLIEGLAGQPELAECANLILAAAQRGTELTERLDRFARRLPPPGAPVAAGPAMAACLARLALPSGVALEAAVAPGLPRIGLAPAALCLALEQLVANAVTAMGGQGRLRIAARLAEGPEPRVLISVEDDGPGIPAAALARLAERRFTAGPAGHRTALGLAITQRVVASAGGSLNMESLPGRGVRVTLDLPAQL